MCTLVILLYANETIIYTMNIMLYWGRLEGASDWYNKLIRNLFTEVINPMSNKLSLQLSSEPLLAIKSITGLALFFKPGDYRVYSLQQSIV